MQANFTDEQKTLRQVAEQLATRFRPDNPRPWEHIPEDDRATSQLMENFAGLGIAESDGGFGGGLLELAIMLHELGRAMVPTSFTSHVLATQVAYAAGFDVSAAVTGEQRWTLAADESGVGPLGPWSGAGSTRKRVAYADRADRVVACVGEDGVAVVPGPFATRAHEAFDITRPAHDLDLGDRLEPTDGGASIALQRAWLLNAAELVGVGRGAVELGAEYAKIRTQFDQQIAKFQGVAHQLADAIVEVENAWSLVLYAAWALDAGTADARNAVHLAAGAAGAAAVFAGERCTQVHGGIGVTWEAMPHVYLRRAVSGSTILGTPAWHRERAGRLLVDEVAV